MKLPSLVCVLDHHGRILETNGAASRWRRSALVGGVGETPHALLHSGCHSETCAFHRSWRELWRGMDSAGRQTSELIDPVLKRRLRLQTERIDGPSHEGHPPTGPYGILHIVDGGPSRSGERRGRGRGAASGRASEIAAAVERERRRLAADLHDGVSQQLALMKLQIESRLLRGFGGDGVPDAEELLRQVVEGLKGTLGEIRQINGSLMSERGDATGLVSRLNELCQCADRVDPETRVTFASPLRDADFLPASCRESLPLAIYRVSQEAVANAVKHSGARTIRVRLSRSGDPLRARGLTLSIADDGRGFDLAAGSADGAEGGMGLTTMRTRALETGGEPSVRSQPGEGTEVSVFWPQVW